MLVLVVEKNILKKQVKTANPTRLAVEDVNRQMHKESLGKMIVYIVVNKALEKNRLLKILSFNSYRTPFQSFFPDALNVLIS